MSSTVRAGPLDPLASGDRELVKRLSTLVTDTQTALAPGFAPPVGGTADLEGATEILAAIALSALDTLRSLDRGDDRIQDLCDLAIRTADLEFELRERDVQRRRLTNGQWWRSPDHRRAGLRELTATTAAVVGMNGALALGLGVGTLRRDRRTDANYRIFPWVA